MYVYDPLQRLASATRTIGGAVNYAYTNSGNIKSKSDFSTTTGTPYSYAGANATVNNCGPHAANAVSLPGNLSATYNCDLNGNVISGNTITAATYDAANRPTLISRAYLEPNTAGDNIFCNGFQTSSSTCPNGVPAGGSNNWAYDSNGMRSYEHSAGVDRYYGPGGYERTIGAVTAHVHELGPVIVTRVGGVDSVTYVLRDRLGSTLDTVDGTKTTGRAYDAFGKARSADMSDRLNGTLNLSDTIHGFTSHTHEDETALVHMNGRVFDPNLGRFLSVDPVGGVGSQRLNPYSYLMNSPFGGTDSTGFDDDASASGKIPYDSNSICAKSWGSCSDGMVTASGSVASFLGRSAGASNSGGASGASSGQGVQTPGEQQQASTNLGNPTAQEPQVQDHGTQAPQSTTQTLETINVTASAKTGYDYGGWIAPQFLTWNLYSAETKWFTEYKVDKITRNAARRVLGPMVGPLIGPIDVGVGVYHDDADQAAWGAFETALAVLPELQEVSIGASSLDSVVPEIAAVRGSNDTFDATTSTLRPGPYAADSIPARSAARDFTPAERQQIDAIGESTGCHTCGNRAPGTKSGHFVPDHQPASSLNPPGGSQSLFPHCIHCSRLQGGQIRALQFRSEFTP